MENTSTQESVFEEKVLLGEIDEREFLQFCKFYYEEKHSSFESTWSKIVDNYISAYPASSEIYLGLKNGNTHQQNKETAHFKKIHNMRDNFCNWEDIKYILSLEHKQHTQEEYDNLFQFNPDIEDNIKQVSSLIDAKNYCLENPDEKNFYFCIEDEGDAIYLFSTHVDNDDLDGGVINILQEQIADKVPIKVKTRIGNKPMLEYTFDFRHFVWGSSFRKEDSSWLNFCLDEEHNWGKGTIYLLATKMTRRSLCIQKRESFVAFYMKYGLFNEYGILGDINWPRVVEDFSSISIMKYFRNFRLYDNSNFYYSWDVASHVIFCADIEEGVSSVHIFELDDYEREKYLTDGGYIELI